MSIFKLLGLKRNATSDEVRKQYIRRLLQVHPDRGGSRDRYMELKTEYEKHLQGDVNENPYSICTKAEASSLVCRCGGRYNTDNEVLGKVECEHCSCFIELVDDLMCLQQSGDHK